MEPKGTILFFFTERYIKLDLQTNKSQEADRIQTHAHVQWPAFYKAMNNLFPQKMGNLFVSTHNCELPKHASARRIS